MTNFWEIPGWEENDKHLNALAKSPFTRKLPKVPDSSGLYMIRGPRQVGKSSWLKLILSNYKRPQKSFYISCENLSDYKELTVLIDSIKKERELILLDEISFVSEWWRSIKSLIDNGYRGRIILTGSHSRELRKGADLMPGRFAKGGEIYLLPMTYSEFIAARKEAKWRILRHEEMLASYFNTGGFPAAVSEGGELGNIPKESMKIYSKWLIGDILKLDKQEQYLRETLLQIATTSCAPISLQKLAQRTQMGSHHTAQDYVAILEDCFALRTCYAIDQNTQGFRFKKEKKFYFTDPLIYRMAYELAGLKVPENFHEIVAEIAAHEHIFRSSLKNNFRFGYLSTTKGEIDFSDGKTWAIEIKWSKHPSLSRAYKELLIPDKRVWGRENLLLEWPKNMQ